MRVAIRCNNVAFQDGATTRAEDLVLVVGETCVKFLRSQCLILFLLGATNRQ